MTLRPCLDCGTPTDRTRCTTCSRGRDRRRNTARGDRYGAAHRAERRAWKPHVATGAVLCARCGEPIAPTALWDLDHQPDGPSQPAHAACNRAARAAPRG